MKNKRKKRGQNSESVEKSGESDFQYLSNRKDGGLEASKFMR